MSAQSVFVAREQELARLDSFLDLSLQGKGQAVLVTGEAGSGKTALVAEFARLAQNKHPDLVVAYGQCNSLTGFADPYLPFQEILQQLLGDVGEMLARGTITEENASRLRKLFSLSGQAIVDVGPELVGVFLPGAGLLAKLAAFAFDKSEWGKKLKQMAEHKQRGKTSGSIDIDQKRIFEQYSNVLNRLADQVPLMLILDDLHWADAASTDLLFHLSRRFINGRLMLVGSYRPEEVALGRQSLLTGKIEKHPLENCIHAIARYRENIFIPLGQDDEAAGRRFIDQYLETEPNRLDEHFRQALFEHTRGNPLFTIELLRNMQERGDLECDQDNLWVEGPSIHWEDFPARIEGVLEERIGRLSDELRKILQVGSVEGERFTAEVIVRVLEANTRKVVDQLSDELVTRHRLIEDMGTQQVKDLWLSIFQFNHNLIRVYIYNKMTSAQRRYFHQDVGQVLEALYGEQADSIALQLARHFEEAGIKPKAVHYLYQAGTQDAARAANTDALEILSRGLELASPSMPAERFDLLLAREKVYSTRGERQAQEADLQELQAIAESLGDERKLAQVHINWSNFYNLTGKYNPGLEAAQKGIELARKTGDNLQEVDGYIASGYILYHMGDYEGSQKNHEAGLAVVEKHLQGATESHTNLPAEEVFDLYLLQAKDLVGLANTIWMRGQDERAVLIYQQARQLFQMLGHRKGEAITINNIAVRLMQQGKYEEASQHYKEGLSIVKAIGDRQSECLTLNNMANLFFSTGDFLEATRLHQEALRIRGEIGDRRGQAMSIGNLGRLSSRQNDHGSARRFFQEALDIFQDIGDRWGSALTLNNLGNTYIHLGEYQTALTFMEKAKGIFEEMDFPGGLADCENNFGVLFYQMGDYEQALTYGRRAIELLDKYGEFDQRLRAADHLGFILEAQQDYSGAAEQYNHSLEMQKKGGTLNENVKPLAGLARVDLAQGNPARALEYVEKILPYLKNAESPYREFQTCYQVMEANSDPRATQYLEEGYHLLMEHASMIPDEESRHSFLENVRDNSEMVALWQEKHQI